MKMQFIAQPAWPALAWLAELAPGRGTVVVEHGARVETADQWFTEAIWCGDFSDADFDRTDRVFGSGARIRGEQVTFVSAGSTVDRLVWAKTFEHTLVSNSLPCLLQRLGASIDVTERGFQKLIGTIGLGIDRYTRELPTSAGPVRMAYFHNLSWDGAALSEREKPDTTPALKTFDDYHEYIQGSVNQLAANLSDSRRRFPFKMLGTMSSGYDSACVAALGHRAGMQARDLFRPVQDRRRRQRPGGRGCAGAGGLPLRSRGLSLTGDARDSVRCIRCQGRRRLVPFRRTSDLCRCSANRILWRSAMANALPPSRPAALVRGDRASGASPFPNIVCALDSSIAPCRIWARCIRISSSPSATLKR